MDLATYLEVALFIGFARESVAHVAKIKKNAEKIAKMYKIQIATEKSSLKTFN